LDNFYFASALVFLGFRISKFGLKIYVSDFVNLIPGLRVLISLKQHRAVFLDRDGTICEDVGYLNSVEQIQLIPRAAEAIRRLNEKGFKTVMVTNQSGVARGFFPESRLKEIHFELTRLLREEEAFLDGVYYCPHYPDEGEEPYRRICECRKPAPGLLLQAAEDLDLDLPASFMIGDHYSDVECAQRVGAQGILVLTGHGQEALLKKENWPSLPSIIVPDLYEAVRWIIFNGEKG